MSKGWAEEGGEGLKVWARGLGWKDPPLLLPLPFEFPLSFLFDGEGSLEGELELEFDAGIEAGMEVGSLLLLGRAIGGADGGLDDRAERFSPEERRLKWRTVEGELPKERSMPRGCLPPFAFPFAFPFILMLLTRRAVGVEPDATRNAVPDDTLRDEDWRRRSGRGEFETAPRGASSRSRRCIICWHAAAAWAELPEGMRASLRRRVG